MSDRFVFFWGHREGARYAPFSQFYRSEFRIADQVFVCTEQWMHWKKALLFGDTEIAEAILATSDPAQHKALGRKVKSFAPKIWEAVARDIVFRGNIAKFSQNAASLEILAATRGKLLVEASPLDTIWGIGLAATDPRAQDPSQWRGTNWLGEVLTEVRVALCGG